MRKLLITTIAGSLLGVGAMLLPSHAQTPNLSPQGCQAGPTGFVGGLISATTSGLIPGGGNQATCTFAGDGGQDGSIDGFVTEPLAPLQPGVTDTWAIYYATTTRTWEVVNSTLTLVTQVTYTCYNTDGTQNPQPVSFPAACDHSVAVNGVITSGTTQVSFPAPQSQPIPPPKAGASSTVTSDVTVVLAAPTITTADLFAGDAGNS